MQSRNRDEQAGGNAGRLFVSSSKVIIVGRFDIPSESMFPAGPEHKIQRRFAAG